MQRFDKLKISLRYYLLGRAETNPEYLRALDALEYAASLHVGLRKDGVTPAFQHQLEIAQYIRSISRYLRYPAQTLAATFLHDVAEDFNIGFEELAQRFGPEIAGAVALLTKKHRGLKIPPEEYFRKMAACAIASVIKGADRINNLQSMLGVFSLQKQKAYCAEVEVYFLPMLKAARREFMDQEPVYENLKLMMRSQLELLRATHQALEAA